MIFSEADIKSRNRDQLLEAMSLAIKRQSPEDIKRIDEECLIRFGFRNYTIAAGPAVPREVQQYYDPLVPQLISHDGKFYRHGPDKPFEFDEAITNKIANAK